MVFLIELTYHEIADIVDTKYIGAKTTGYTLPPVIYEISDLTLMIKFLLPDDIKIYIAIDDIRLKINLLTNKLKSFTQRSFLDTKLDFTQSHSGFSNDSPQRIFQKLPGFSKYERPLNITGIEKM